MSLNTILPSLFYLNRFHLFPPSSRALVHNITQITTTDLANRNYIKWDAEGVEKKQENEDADIQAVADMINEIQRSQYNVHRHAYTGTHARTQGVIKGTFEVLDDLPAHLKQGELFTKGGSYPVVARYSSEPGDPGLNDQIPVPRGFTMKVFDVHGDFLENSKEFPTQDIEVNSTPALDLATAKVTKEIIDLRIQYGGNQPELYKHLEGRDDTELQKFRDTVENTRLESTLTHSHRRDSTPKTAYRFGDYVMKHCLVPNSETQKKRFERKVNVADGSDILHRWAKDFHAEHDTEYLFQVQLCENFEDQPVEYAGKLWDAQKYPWQTVARVRFPKQNNFDYKRKAFWEDRMRVDPWHGLKAYQPLGSPKRLRKVVYPASSKLRREMNGTTEINVKSIDEVP